jgi:membrane associated rhomboid family serine protease
MEWSLVLVSQGIETGIDCSLEDGAWGLLVAPGDYERAMSALFQYRVENRGWPWQQRVSTRAYLFDWGSLAWVLLIGLFFWLDSRIGFRSSGVMDSALVAKGQWWRLFTAVWLHADISHLATNATFGFILLGLAMGRFGTGVGLLAAYLAGVVGNVCPLLMGLGVHRSLGASGMVMGALGLLASQSLELGRSAPRSFRAASVVAGVMLFVLFGLSPDSDVLAHLGGFGGGLVFGATLVRFPSTAGGTKTNLACGLAFTVLVLLPWWLAFRNG